MPKRTRKHAQVLLRGRMEEGATSRAGSDDVVALEVRVVGRVQGVGYRYFVYELARRLGVVGYVTNLPDGSVRAYAEGTRATLEAFCRQTVRGPAGSCVREAKTHWGHATGQYRSFSIERTR